jgi:hypothetical protein
MGLGGSLLGGIKLAQDRVQWRALVLIVFGLSGSITRDFLSHSLIVHSDKMSHGSFLS